MLTTISEILLKRETIERDEFEALLAGKAPDQVFGPPEPAETPPAPPVEEPSRQRAPEPRPLPHPRPGYAAEMRGDDSQPPKV